MPKGTIFGRGRQELALARGQDFLERSVVRGGFAFRATRFAAERQLSACEKFTLSFKTDENDSDEILTQGK
jgi:hypothetical protein